MRIWLVFLLAVAVGCSAGAATSWYGYGNVVNYFEPVSRTKSGGKGPRPVLKGPRAVVVGGAKFDFGSITFNGSGSRTFVIRNEGDEPLRLTNPMPSCGKCIQTGFTQAVVQPGESTEIVVGYAARKDETSFNESLELDSTDPLLTKIRLDITGAITRPVRVLPNELALGSVSSSENSSATLNILGYETDEIQLVGMEFSNPSTADRIQISASPLTSDEAKAADPNARCGLKLDVTTMPGLPVGQFNQIVALKVKAGEGEHKVEITVSGEVVGDITVMGRNFSAEKRTLNVGVVNRAQGYVGTLHLLVKGPHRNDVQLSITEVQPADVMKAKLGEGMPIGDGKAIKYPLTIEIAKNAAVQTHLGDARGRMAQVMVETTHPTLKQIPINVRFAIE